MHFESLARQKPVYGTEQPGYGLVNEAVCFVLRHWVLFYAAKRSS